MSEALKLKMIKYGMDEGKQAQMDKLFFIVNLEHRYIILLKGMQYWIIDNTISAHSCPCEITMRETGLSISGDRMAKGEFISKTILTGFDLT